MVPLLLLLLLPASLASHVCLSVFDSGVTINMTGFEDMQPITITDERTGYVRCFAKGVPCVFQCLITQKLNTASTCFKAMVKNSTYEFKNCSLHLCIDNEIVPVIYSLDSSSSDQRDMMNLFYIRASCIELFTSNSGVKENYIQVEKHIIHNIMETSNLEAGSSVSYNMQVMSLQVVNISKADLNSTEPWIQMNGSQLLPQNASFIPEIFLPVNALHALPTEKRVIGLVSYMWHNQFQFEQEVISSAVIRIEMQQTFRDLKTPIKMTFRIIPRTDGDPNNRSNAENLTVSTNYQNASLQCRYFDKNAWKTDGCVTIDNNRTDSVICECDHATPFAVLLIRDSVSEIHWQILSYISYIGCGLSAFFTAVSLVIYVFSRKQKMDFSISIHVSLSGALFLLNSTFLLTEWGATVEPDWVCVFVAALMHYSLLCCFTWMAIEALHVYLLLIKVFNTYFKCYLLKLSLAGWGIPGVIVAISLGMKDYKQFYGLTHMTMAESSQTNAICWITDNSFFYSLNLVYFTLIFIFNAGILIAVTSNICKMKQVLRSKPRLGAQAEGKTESFSDTCRSCVTVMGLTCLMGTTWGLAFLGSGYVNYPILYLFCILNSTQGFFIFLWICLSAKRQRKRDMESGLTSMPVKTSAVKFD